MELLVAALLATLFASALAAIFGLTALRSDRPH